MNMTKQTQKRALPNVRPSTNKRGLMRFEVLGLDADRDLIRSLARRLAEGGPVALSIRSTLTGTIATEPSRIGGILAALRRSPLVESGLELTGARDEGRSIDL